jgi:hypothetical protein
MCCTTHDERDRQDVRNGKTFTYAENEQFRCQCDFGNKCRRRATQEDRRCDWCRGTNHETACGELGVMYGPAPDESFRYRGSTRVWTEERAIRINLKPAGQDRPDIEQAIQEGLQSAVQDWPGMEWFRSSGYGWRDPLG